MRMVRQVPKMRRWLGSEKCRSRGERAGAEDGDVSQGRVSVHAEDGDVVARVGAVSMAGMEKTKAAHGMRGLECCMRLMAPLMSRSPR